MEEPAEDPVETPQGGGAELDASAPVDEAEPGTSALIADTSGALLECVSQIDRLSAKQAAWKAEFLDQARRVALMTEEAVVTVGKNFTPAQRQDLARRAFISEVACELRIPERSAIALIDESKALMHELPLTLAALRDGEISYRHAQILIDEVATLDARATAQLEQIALPFARTLTPARFRQKARTLRETLRPESAIDRREKCATDRKIEYLPARDGMAWLNLYTTAPVAGALFTSIRAQSVSLQGPTEPRTLGQLDADVCADALFDGLTAGASGADARAHVTAGATAGDGAGAGSTETDGDAPAISDDGAKAGTSASNESPSTGSPESEAPVTKATKREPTPAAKPGAEPGAAFRKVKPNVTITVPILSLLGRSDEPATLDGYGPVDIETARRLVGQATSFTRVLTDPESGAAVVWGTKRYKPTEKMKEFLGYRDQRCRFPGCNHAAVFCDIDHTVAFRFGGATELDNLAALCPKHHRLKHDTTWKVEQIGGGTLRWTSPNGREYVTYPENEVRPFKQLTTKSTAASDHIAMSDPSDTSATLIDSPAPADQDTPPF